MIRRQVLRMAGSGLAAAAGGGAAAAGGDADPRPEPHEGTRPNRHVPTTSTGALPDEPAEIPAGTWVSHDNGWLFPGTRDEPLFGDCRKHARFFAENTVQTYTVDGEEFLLDGFDDWAFVDDVAGPQECSLDFEYVTPPKPRGETYEVRWEFEAEVDRFAFLEQFFPFSKRVEVVDRR